MRYWQKSSCMESSGQKGFTRKYVEDDDVPNEVMQIESELDDLLSKACDNGVGIYIEGVLIVSTSQFTFAQKG